MNLGDFVSQLSEGQLGLAGGGVLVLFIVLGVIKGVIRVVLGITGFIAAAIAFWFSFKHGDSLISNFTESPEPWMPLGIAGTAAAAAYTAVRHGVGIVLLPMLGSLEKIKHAKLVSGVAGLGLGGFGLYSGGSASHQFNAMNFLNDKVEHRESGWVSTLLNKTQGSWFGELQQITDPTKTAYRCDLIKGLTVYTTGQAQGEKKTALAPLLAQHEFLRLASSPKIAQNISQGDFTKLFNDPQVKNFLSKKEHREILRDIDWQKL